MVGTRGERSERREGIMLGIAISENCLNLFSGGLKLINSGSENQDLWVTLLGKPDTSMLAGGLTLKRNCMGLRLPEPRKR